MNSSDEEYQFLGHKLEDKTPICALNYDPVKNYFTDRCCAANSYFSTEARQPEVDVSSSDLFRRTSDVPAAKSSAKVEFEKAKQRRQVVLDRLPAMINQAFDVNRHVVNQLQTEREAVEQKTGRKFIIWKPDLNNDSMVKNSPEDNQRGRI